MYNKRNRYLNDLVLQALGHLEDVCNHADEDCPQEYRSKWYDTSIQDARAFIKETMKDSWEKENPEKEDSDE
tara:strand:- start:361 stop:576 length:216 start_codon:yes stop_codon:yes gene_type:complete